MSVEAMKQALVALGRVDKVTGFPHNQVTIAALHQAIKDEEESFRPDYDTNAVLLERIRELEAQLEQEPVAWQVHPFDYGIGHEGAYALTTRPEQVDAWKRKGWDVQPLYPAPMSIKHENIDTKTEHVDSVNIKPVCPLPKLTIEQKDALNDRN